MRDRKLPISLILIVLLGFVLPSSLWARDSFTLAPPPSWVLAPPKLPSDAEQPAEGDLGLRHLLYDRQIRVAAGSVDRYFCQRTKILSSAHLERVSKLELEFEPSYQKLLIHYIRLRRGSKTINALRPQEIKIIQKESELDEQLYSGTLSAVIFINDVRVGDVLEYAYSVNGLNPIFQGSYSATFYLAQYESVEFLRCRLLWPLGRALYFKNQNAKDQPSTHASGKEMEYLWVLHQVPAVAYEDDTPDWYQPVPQVQISEFKGWDGVVSWALPLYAANEPLSPDLALQIEAWRKSLAKPEARFLAALRFVQDEVRYLGIEMGPHSHLPHPPSVVFARRYGDCKDKSLLLITIFRALGIEASPALVNTELRGALDEHQPTPLAFNHVIVKARLDDRIYWVDPTVSLQRGGLKQLSNPDFGRALVIQKGSSSLEEIPHEPASTPRTVTKETYRADDFNAPATLEVVTTYSGKDADDMRNASAEQSLAELGKSYLNYYSEADPAITSDGTPRLADDPESNTLIITESYHIPDFWRSQSRWFIPGLIQARLRRPSLSRRTMPLGIPHPLDLTNIIQVHLPKNAFSPESDSGSIENKFMQLFFEREFKRSVLTLQYHLRTLQDSVPVDQVANYLEDLNEMRETVRFKVEPKGKNEIGKTSWTGLIIVLLVAGGLTGIAIMKAKRLRNAAGERRPPKKIIRPAGDGPENSIHITAEEEAPKHLRPKKCACGNPLYREAQLLHRDTANFDGHRLLIVHLQCEKCERTLAVYFELTNYE